MEQEQSQSHSRDEKDTRSVAEQSPRQALGTSRGLWHRSWEGPGLGKELLGWQRGRGVGGFTL